jgi:hypothetical protein
MNDPIYQLIKQVNASRLRTDLFYLSKEPLPFRKVNFTRGGQDKNSLEETDDFILKRLELLGYPTQEESCKVQTFRCDRSKPLHHWYSAPQPDDPWYKVVNIYARKMGVTNPGEIIVVVSHKDSPSWIDSPGAYDNAVGTVANLEIARILQPVKTKRTIWHLYCNEEHTPWTSVTAAQGAKKRGDNIIAVFNIDGIGGKSQSEINLGVKTNIARYSTPEGKKLADLLEDVVKTYHIPLMQTGYAWDGINDDDGSFINAGYPDAIANIGSFPYSDPHYHMEGDTAEHVDIENVFLATQAILAAVARMAGVLD